MVFIVLKFKSVHWTTPARQKEDRKKTTAITMKRLQKKSLRVCTVESIQCSLKGVVIFGQTTTLRSKSSIVGLLPDAPQKRNRVVFRKCLMDIRYQTNWQCSNFHTTKESWSFEPLSESRQPYISKEAFCHGYVNNSPIKEDLNPQLGISLHSWLLEKHKKGKAWSPSSCISDFPK